MKKTTKDAFITLCDVKFPGLYEYDLLPDEFGQAEQITLICKQHGEFKTSMEQLRQNKEPLCWMCRAKSKEELIRLVEMRYPNIYDFSEVPDYFSSTDMFTVKYKDDGEEEETNYKKLTSYITKKYIPNLNSFKIEREEFVSYCENKWLGKYDYSRVPIRIKEDTMLVLWCNEHHVFINTNLKTIKQRGYICAYCHDKLSEYNPTFTGSDKKRNITRELFITEAEEKYGKNIFDYKFVPENIRTRDKVTIRCIKHNTLFDVYYHEFIDAVHPCPTCNLRYERQFQTKDKLLNIASKRFKDKPYDYSLVPETFASTDTLHIKCLKHDIIFDVKYKNFLRQKEICPKCMQMSKEELIQILTERNDTNYDFSEIPDAFGMDTKLHFTCLKHHKTFEICFADIKQKRHNICPDCGAESYNEKNKEKFLRKAIEKYGDRFDYSEVDYQGVFSEVKIYCNEHQKFFMTTPDTHLRSTGCPDCIKHFDGLVKQVTFMLDNYHIEYITEKTFEWLRYKKSMRLDVFIPSMNIAIEAHGEQHFLPNNYFDKNMTRPDETFELRVKRDTLKFNQCQEHGIQVLYYSDKNYVDEYPLGHVYTDVKDLYQAIIKLKGSD